MVTPAQATEDKTLQTLRSAGRLISQYAGLVDSMQAQIQDLKNSKGTREEAVAKLQSVLDENALTTSGENETVGEPLPENPTPGTDAALKFLDELPQANPEKVDQAMENTVDSEEETPTSVFNNSLDAILQNMEKGNAA